MTTYRCRFVAPRQSEWRAIEADSPESAAHELHFRDEKNYAISYDPDPSLARRIYFARIEVEGHADFISRIFTSGIVRRGGIGRKNTIADVARTVGWSAPPEELLEDGWAGEEKEWSR